MQKRLFVVSLFLMMVYAGVAQPSQSQAFLPKLMPQSPDVASLNRYGSIPVNLFTGVPDISIPLFEINVGELKVPITLSYHAAGNRVTDNPSRVGLGWSVSAGGTISRKMMGKPDEQEGNYLSGITSRESGSINTDTYDGLNYLWNVSQGVADAEPDIFSYSMPGKSGKFIFNQRDNFKPIIMPYDPLVITRSHPTTATMLFNITDESGIQYKFETYEWTANSSGASTQYAISSWPLTKMISSNKKDTIFFNYNDVNTQDAFFSDGLTVSDQVSNQQGYTPYADDPGTPYVSNSYINTTAKICSEIVFRGGKLVFEEGSEIRQDFNGAALPKRLNRMLVYSFDPVIQSYRLVRTIQLYQSYFMNGTDVYTKRLRLDSLSFKGTDANTIETYRFDYNNSIGLPRKDSRQKDYWGYFNNKSNSSLIPRIQIPYVGVGGVTTIWVGSNILNGRDPDPLYMQAWILTRMSYPTGGYTDFEFETNKYADQVNNQFFAGGLRIKKISTYDGINLSPIIRMYKYGLNESGAGRANFILSDYFFQTTQNNRYIIITQGPTVVGSKRTRTFLSSPTCDLESYDGSIVVYPFVTEYYGSETVNQGRTIYEFNDREDVLNPVSSFV